MNHPGPIQNNTEQELARDAWDEGAVPSAQKMSGRGDPAEAGLPPLHQGFRLWLVLLQVLPTAVAAVGLGMQSTPAGVFLGPSRFDLPWVFGLGWLLRSAGIDTSNEAPLFAVALLGAAALWYFLGRELDSFKATGRISGRAVLLLGLGVSSIFSALLTPGPWDAQEWTVYGYSLALNLGWCIFLARCGQLVRLSRSSGPHAGQDSWRGFWWTLVIASGLLAVGLLPVLPLQFPALGLALVFLLPYAKWVGAYGTVTQMLRQALRALRQRRSPREYALGTLVLVTLLALAAPSRTDSIIAPVALLIGFAGLILLLLLRRRQFLPELSFEFNGRVYTREWWRSRKKWHLALLGGLLWVSACGFIENGQVISIVPLVASAILVLRWIFPRLRDWRWITVAGGVMPAAILLTGSYNPDRDLFCIAGGFVLAYGLFLKGKGRGWRALQLRTGCALVAITWGLCSLGDMVFAGHPAPLHPERFAQLRSRNRFPGKQVGIALSGGGYRASVMHAGILHELERFGIQPAYLDGVSGGSFTAAYYALGGSPEDLLDSLRRGRLHLLRDAMDAQNALRMIFPARIPWTNVRLLPFYSFSRSDVQSEALDRVLLQGKTFADVPAGGPKLMICMSDLGTGRAYGVASHWALSHFLLRPPGEETFANTRQTYGGMERMLGLRTLVPGDWAGDKLSRMAAASAAYPLVFPPLKLHTPIGSIVVGDGGITDNTGMTLMMDATRKQLFDERKLSGQEWKLDLAISADAGAAFSPAGADGLNPAGRAVDVMSYRVGYLPATAVTVPRILLSPAMYVDPSIALTVHYRLAIDPFEFNGNMDLQKIKLALLVISQLSQLDERSLRMLAELDPDRLGAAVKNVLDNRLTEADLQALTNATNVDEKERVQLARLKLKREDEALRQLAYECLSRFSERLSFFLNVPTMSEVQGGAARRLYELGEMLVILNGATLQNSLAPGSAQPVLGAAEKLHFECDMDALARPGNNDHGARVQACMADVLAHSSREARDVELIYGVKLGSKASAPEQVGKH